MLKKWTPTSEGLVGTSRGKKTSVPRRALHHREFTLTGVLNAPDSLVNVAGDGGLGSCSQDH